MRSTAAAVLTASGWEPTGWTVHRSYINGTTWIPVREDGDQTCFLYAGQIRQVKEWVIRQQPDSKYQWLRLLGGDTYELWRRASDLSNDSGNW